MVERVDDFDILLCRTELRGADAGKQPDQEAPSVLQHPTEGRQALSLPVLRPRRDCSHGSPYPAPTTPRTAKSTSAPTSARPPCGRCSTSWAAISRCAAARSNSRSNARTAPACTYDTGQCHAPCAGFITEEAYGEILQQVRRVFKRRYPPGARGAAQKMEEAAAQAASTSRRPCTATRSPTCR